jgi:predicted RNA-binding Zn ribbon-like protein
MDTTERHPTTAPQAAAPQSAAPQAAAPQSSAPLHGEPLPVELMNTVWADRDGVHDSLRDTADLAAWLRAVAPRLPAGLGAGQDPREAGAERRAQDVAEDAAEDAAEGAGPAGPGSAGHRDALTGSAALPGLLAEFRQLRAALRRLAGELTGDDRHAADAATGRPDLRTAVRQLNEACGYAPASSYLEWPAEEGGAGGAGGTPLRALHSPYPPAAAALSAIGEEGVLLFSGDAREQLRACHAPGCVLYFVKTHPRRAWCSAGCGNRARVARHYQRHHGGRP